MVNTTGVIGTARAQYHLRQVMVFLNMFPLNRPEVMVGNANERFDTIGNLTDEETRRRGSTSAVLSRASRIGRGASAARRKLMATGAQWHEDFD